MTISPDSKPTPLYDWHLANGAKMIPFADWNLPFQYEGVIAEHQWCRSSAALFDVSHMCIIELHETNAAAKLESLTPSDIVGLDKGRQRYGLLTNDDGGTVDDFIATNWGDHIMMVTNASRREIDLAYLADKGLEPIERDDLALLALQGPEAASAITALVANPALVEQMRFLDHQQLELNEIGPVMLARSGYSGEDGFEIAVQAQQAQALAEALTANPAVKPAGLGSRDTLRLEAGLCLYGNDLDETTSPVEADLTWTIAKQRRSDSDRPFAGQTRILRELAEGPSRIRVGIQPSGRRPLRAGTALTTAGTQVGVITSGGFGPSLTGPVAMGYVSPDQAEPGTALIAESNEKQFECVVRQLPFSPHRYKR